MTNTKRIVCAFALLLAACGSGSDDAAKEPVETAASAASTAATQPASTGSTEAPSTSAEATTTTAAVTVDAEVGTRENPVAVGSYFEQGDWLVRVASVDPDAAEELMAQDDFVDAPAAGNVYFAIHLEGAYIGDGSASLWESFFFSAVGASNVEYDEFEDDCGFIEGSLSSQGEAFPGGSVAGIECFEVSAPDADTLTLYLEPTGFGGERVFYAVRDGEGSATGLTPPTNVGGDGAGDVGTRDNPIAIGSFGTVGDWHIRINAADLDATDAVQALNQFNEPPEPGTSYVLADVEVAYTGTDPSEFWFELDWAGVGPSNVALDRFDASCGSLGGPIDNGADFYPNGRASGPVCMAVPDVELDGFVMFFEQFGGERLFFSIHAGEGAPTDVSIPTVSWDPGTAEGSFGNPITAGTPARVADWDLAVVGFDADATDRVLAENQFNEPPAEGNVFVMIDLEATYRGDSSSTVWADTSWSLLLPSNIAVGSFDASCGSIPDDIAFADEAFEGGTITGSVCFEVAAADASAVTLVFEDFTDFDAEPVFYTVG